MTPERLAEIDAREKAATPGPWDRKPSLSMDSTVESRSIGVGDVPDVTIEVMGDRARADADFMAHARADVPDLLAAVRERDAEIERLRAENAGLRTQAADAKWDLYP